MKTLKYIFTALLAVSISTLYADTSVSTFEAGLTSGTVFVDEWEGSPFNNNRCENTTVEVIDNPYATEMNETSKVLHYVRPYYAGDRNGVEIKLENSYTLSTAEKYLHVLVHKPNTARMVLAAIDKQNNVQQVIVKAMTEARANAWSDIVFAMKGNGYEIDRIRIYPDCESSVNRLSGDIDIYIDEIIYSDSPTPRTATGYCKVAGTLSNERYISYIATSGALLNIKQANSGKATTIPNKSNSAIIANPGAQVNLTFAQKSTGTNTAWVADVYADFNGDYEFVADNEYIGRINGTTNGDSILYSATITVPSDAKIGFGGIRIKMTDSTDPLIAGNNHGSCANVQNGVVYDIAMDIQKTNVRPVVKVEGLAEQGSWGTVAISNVDGTEVNVTQGTKVTVVATPAAGYSFVAWKNKETSSVISTDARFSFSVQTHITLVAVFAKVLYCEPAGTTPVKYFLGNATITPEGKSTLDYNVGEMTSNYTAKSILGGAIVKRGTSFALDLQQASSSANLSETNISLWADWNSNHIFEANELLTTATGKANNSFTVMVPTTALKGTINVRARIFAGEISADDACANVGNGSTYDFEITVAPNDNERFSVTAVPSIAGAATFTLSPEPDANGTYAAGTNVNITAVPASGYTFVQWKKDGVPYGATMTSNNPLPITGLSEDLHLTMAVEALLPSYCAGSTPNNGNGNHYGIMSGSLAVNGVVAFTFSTEETIADFSSTCIADVCPGDILSLTVESSTEHLKWAEGYAYIDWDMNGTWDTTSESYQLFNDNYTTSNKTTTIVVPSNVGVGPCGMRLCSGEASKYNNLGGGPCQARKTGRLQTFRINVSAPPISSLSPQVIVSYDETMGEVTINGQSENIYDAEEGERVTLEATAFDGYEFRGWTTSQGTMLSTSSTYSFTVEKVHNIVALFVSQAMPTYCTGTGAYESYTFYLSSLSITAPSSSVSVTSTTSSLNDYTDSKILEVRNGEQMTITFSSTSSNTKWGNVVIFADWNRDGVFNTADEKYDIFGGADGSGQSGHQYSNETYTITVPMSAYAGLTAIRVISEEATQHNTANNFDPCGNRHKGSVHTFGMRIIDPTVDCNAPIADNNAITFYPNPIKSNLYVHTPVGAQIRVIGLDGITLVETVALDESSLLNVNGLSSGIYLLQVVSADGISTYKVVKE